MGGTDRGCARRHPEWRPQGLRCPMESALGPRGRLLLRQQHVQHTGASQRAIQWLMEPHAH
eukprot:4844612-Pyramimonas_sp.AAC.1